MLLSCRCLSVWPLSTVGLQSPHLRGQAGSPGPCPSPVPQTLLRAPQKWLGRSPTWSVLSTLFLCPHPSLSSEGSTRAPAPHGPPPTFVGLLCTRGSAIGGSSRATPHLFSGPATACLGHPGSWQHKWAGSGTSEYPAAVLVRGPRLQDQPCSAM